MFLDTVNQLDFSFSKSVRTRGVEFRPEVGIFNMLNASPVTAQTNTFGPNLDRVTAILPARLVRLGDDGEILTATEHVKKSCNVELQRRRVRRDIRRAISFVRSVRLQADTARSG